jgi:hypothetical protein
MSTPPAIRATFSQYAMVKTRGVLVLHMEVPLEQQAEVFKVLGYPLPGEEVWCGIARLKPIEPGVGPGSGETAPGQTHDAVTAGRDRQPSFAASERGKARYASASDMERARTRAALLPKDARFQQWVIDNHLVVDGLLSNEEAATFYIREYCCAGESRKLIAEDEACYRAFIAMETDYLLSIGALPEVR